MSFLFINSIVLFASGQVSRVAKNFFCTLKSPKNVLKNERGAKKNLPYPCLVDVETLQR